MKLQKNVRGTMKSVPPIEVNVDTVYERTNIVRIEEPSSETAMGFVGWEYDEKQYGINEYIEKISNDNNNLEQEIADLWFSTLESGL